LLGFYSYLNTDAATPGDKVLEVFGSYKDSKPQLDIITDEMHKTLMQAIDNSS